MTDTNDFACVGSLAGAAGVWLLVSPFIIQFPNDSASLLNNVVLGAVTALSAMTNVFRTRHLRWLSWATLVSGVMATVSPWVLRFSHATPIRNNVVIGIVISLCGLWCVLDSSHPHRPQAQGSSA